MARSLDQILAELNPQYATSENILNTRINAIPGETDAGISQADAKLGEANTNILNSARRRGTGVAFGGIPIADQTKYAATEYAPAIANLRATGANKELTLQEQLANLARDKSTQAQSIYDTGIAQDLQERTFQESIRQFNEQQAAARAAAAAASYSFGGAGGGAAGTTAPVPNRATYSTDLQGLEAQLKSGKAPTYEQAVDALVGTYGKNGISPQEIGNYLYELYSRFYNTSQTKKYYGPGSQFQQTAALLSSPKQTKETINGANVYLPSILNGRS